MSMIRDLHQLQLVDSEHQERTRRLAQVERDLKGTGEVGRARDAVAEMREELGRLGVLMRDLELAIAAVNTKLQANQDRLYSGRVRNPKELANLQEEAAALRRRLAELEDDQLELMIATEESEAELAERRARQRQIETTWTDQESRLLAEKAQLEFRLAELEEDCTSRRGMLRPSDLALYDDLRNRLGGRGVVLLKRGTCEACGVDVPTGVARAVQRGEGTHFCPTCNRLLCG